ncbi:MAG TPA: hypothetical protein VGO40_12270 [Longimicrobium sp.]|jgi:hypothetical protein|nr:hypothetical protein [Longimicrobium sp.]
MNPIYLVVLNSIAFAGLFAGVTLLLSFFSGWTSLARAYRGGLATVTDRVWMGSGGMNRFGIPVRYRNCLNVSVGDEGVQLSVFPLFALASPRLLIPWSDVGACQSYRLLGLMDRFSFRPVLCDVKITLAGSAARMVKEQVASGAIRRALAAA